MIRKVGWLKNAIARAEGLFDSKGKKLKGVRLDEQFVAAWNGFKEEVVEVAAKVEQKIEDTLDVEIDVFTEEKKVEEKPKTKKKGYFKKK